MASIGRQDGFLSLFSRKGKSEKQQQVARLLKSQAYSNGAELPPPARGKPECVPRPRGHNAHGGTGPYQAAGNGQIGQNYLLDPLAFGQSRLSLGESIAPPPAVPRVTERSVERPLLLPMARIQTTPGGGDAPKGPPVAFRSPVKAKHVHDEYETVRTAVKKAPDPPRLSFAHQRAESMRLETAKAFVDLLDAQSEIKPPDFRTRVKATGARDYGEDVADRNIGVNGVNLDSSHVQAFYATATTTALAPRDPPPVGLASERAGLRRINQDSDGSYHQITKQISKESALRTKSLTSSHPSVLVKPVPAAALPPPPAPPPAGSTPANSSRSRTIRRQTLSTLIPSSPSSSSSPLPKLLPRGLQREAAALRDPGLFISTRRQTATTPPLAGIPRRQSRTVGRQ